MAKTKKPEQAIFYQNFKGAIYGGTPEQVKNLMTAFCQYALMALKHHPSGDLFLWWSREMLSKGRHQCAHWCKKCPVDTF